MKKLLITSAIMLMTTGAYALDQNVGTSSEYYGSPLTDHGPAGGKSGQLSATHDHGDDTVKNFAEHGHDQRIVQTPPAGSGSGHMMPAMHDHGDDVVKDYTAHEDK
jgi:hypothetical protein